MFIEVTGLSKGKYRCEFPAPDVHIKRLGTNIQEALGMVEFPELAEHLNGRGSIGNDHRYFTLGLKGADEFFPAQEVKLAGRVALQGLHNLHFGDSQFVSEQERHLRTIFIVGFPDGL